MQIIKFIIIVSFFLQASNAWSVTKTRDIYDWCTTLVTTHDNPANASKEDWYKAGMCDGFFTGFNDGEYLQYLKDASKSNSKKNGEQLSEEFDSHRAWCEPEEGITLKQRILMFNKYVKEHPESLHNDSYLTLLKVMKPHFPCQE